MIECASVKRLDPDIPAGERNARAARLRTARLRAAALALLAVLIAAAVISTPLPARAQADLTVSYFSIVTPAGQPGGVISIDFTIQNIGTACRPTKFFKGLENTFPENRHRGYWLTAITWTALAWR